MSNLIALYWGTRDESLICCTDKVILSLKEMKKFGYDSFGNYGNGAKKAVEVNKIDLDGEFIDRYMANLLIKGLNRDYENKYPIPELGYSIKISAHGVVKDSYSISIQCASTFSTNYVLFQRPSGDLSDLNDQEKLRSLYISLMSIWNPDQAIITRNSPIEWDESGDLVKNEDCIEYYKLKSLRNINNMNS